MMSRRSVLLVAALLLTMGSTGAFAQEEDGRDLAGEADVVTFYGHVFNHGLSSPMPANTEAPVGEDNYGIGTGGDCESASPVITDCESASWNKLALFSTAGFVDVANRAEFQGGGDYSQLHNERGQTKDIVLDTNEAITAGIHLTMDLHGWFVSTGETNCFLQPHPEDVPCLYPYWGWDPGVAENVVVTATLYKANLGEHGANASDAPPIEQVFQDGEYDVIAEGQWGPDTVINGLPGSPNANHFEIDLGPPQVDTIPRDEDFFLVYSVHQEAGGQTFLIDGDVRWWAGEFFPQTFTLPVKNAFDVERVIPNFAHGKMAILGVMNTPWGSYDIDSESIELEIEGPDGSVTPERLDRFGDVSFAHGGHYLPINVTWVWDYQAQELPAGTYDVTVSAQNFQGSAQGSCTASFTLEPGQGRGTVPATTDPGTCGFQTISQERLQAIEEGAAEEAGG